MLPVVSYTQVRGREAVIATSGWLVTVFLYALVVDLNSVSRFLVAS